MALTIELSDIEITYEREVYAMIVGLSDFGGFNDGIILLPAILISIYSQKMYLKSLFTRLPIKRTSNSKENSNEKMKEKCFGD